MLLADQSAGAVAQGTAWETEITHPHVLVCEDESEILDEISEYFHEDGIAISTAADGYAAAMAFKDAPPGTFSVVVTDLRMPQLDGASLAKGILASSDGAHAVEVIVMSGHGAEEMRIRQQELGLFAVLQKPLNLADLAATVLRAHDSAMTRRAAARAG